jgi:hypothetical protein
MAAASNGFWAGLAQLVERLICNQDVTSSNLVAGTTFPFLERNILEPSGNCPLCLHWLESDLLAEVPLRILITLFFEYGKIPSAHNSHQM